MTTIANLEGERKSSRVRKATHAITIDQMSREEEKLLRLALEKSKDEIQAPVSLLPSQALELHPTLEEFMNPIEFITKSKELIAKNGGIAKIIPPVGWNCPFRVNVKDIVIPTKEQRINRLGEGLPYGTGKDYNFDSYKKMAENFRKNWETILKNRGENVADPQVWEKLYWRIVENGEGNVMVEYGNDVSITKRGGGFPVEKDSSFNPWLDYPNFTNESYYARCEWNPVNIARARGSVLGNLRDLINGINIPWLYFGMTFATFSWHVEDNWLYSLNYHHVGHDKIWYGIAPENQKRFGETLKQMMPVRFDQEPNLLSDIVTMVNPQWLLHHGIGVCSLVQHAGEFVITLPGAYHGGFSVGFNCGEAVNFAPIDWITPGRLCRDVYRSQARLPVIAHDKIVWGLASKASLMNNEDLHLLISELEILYNAEFEMRSCSTKAGVVFNVQMPAEDPTSDESDIRRTCLTCNQPCSLHAIICHCAPEKTACGYHHQNLCNCPAIKKALIVWFSLDSLKHIIDAVKDELQTRNL